MKKFSDRFCVICGKSFTPKVNHQKCCGDKCRAIRTRSVQLECIKKRKEEKAKEQKRKPKQKAKTVTDLAVEARKAGMSYGQYVAKLEGRC